MRVLLVLATFAVACGPAASDTKTAPVAETCRVQLAPRTGPREELPRPFVAQPTRMIAHVDLKLARVKTELEAKVPIRVAEERGQNIGPGGHLNYTADRGPFTITIENDALVARTDVRAHAEACRGSDCYASCDPIARATAIVPLRLGPGFNFAPSKVTAQFTKRCEVRALGGLVRVDVTPTIEGRLGPNLRRIEQQIDKELPPLRPQAERLWNELEQARPLPLGGCIVVEAAGIVQGPVTGSGDIARVRFAVLAAPEIRTRCGVPPSKRPLPPLAQDPTLPAEDEVAVGLVGPLANALTSLRDLAPFDTGAGRTRIADALGRPTRDGVAVVADLRGEVCGPLEQRSPLVWQPDGSALSFATPVLTPGEEERVRGAGLDAKRTASAFGGARLPPPIPPANLKELLPGLGSALSDPGLEVTVKITSVTPLDVHLRDEDLIARVRLRGSVELREK